MTEDTDEKEQATDLPAPHAPRAAQWSPRRVNRKPNQAQRIDPHETAKHKLSGA